MAYTHISKQDPLFTLKALCINYFVNRKIGELQKIKNNSVYEIECSKLETVNYFSESKQTLNPCSDEHNRSVRNCDCENDEIAKLRWQRNHNFT